MERKTLTNRQREILDCIESHIEQYGYPPTVREIGRACRLKSPRSVSQHLDSLQRKGYIKRRKDKSRAIELLAGRLKRSINLPEEPALVALPLVGRVPAGKPSLAIEEYEVSYEVDENLFGSGEAFLLRAEGESMVGAHIIDGDLLVVRPEQNTASGDIVVAMVGDEATVKRFIRDGKKVLLAPENNEMEPIELNEKDGDVRILGKVVGIIRRVQ